MQLPNFFDNNFRRLVDSFKSMRNVEFASCKNKKHTRKVIVYFVNESKLDVYYYYYYWEKLMRSITDIYGNAKQNINTYLQFNFKLIYFFSSRIQILQFNLEYNDK